MESVLLAVRIGLAGVFLVSGVGKALDIRGSIQAMRDFQLPEPGAVVLGRSLPFIELTLAALLLPTATARIAAIVAFFVVGVFVAAMAKELRAGRSPNCHCFGQIQSAPVSNLTIARNVGLMLLAAFVAAGGSGASLAPGSVPAWLLAAVVVVSLALAVASATLWRVKGDGSIGANSEANAATKLEQGDAAPDLDLLAVDGSKHQLFDVAATDRSSLVVFASPGCGACSTLMPRLSQWQAAISDDLRIVIGQVVEVDRLGETIETYTADGISGEMWSMDESALETYAIAGTPSAILISPERKIDSEIAVGADAIERLARNALRKRAGRRQT